MSSNGRPASDVSPDEPGKWAGVFSLKRMVVLVILGMACVLPIWWLNRPKYKPPRRFQAKVLREAKTARKAAFAAPSHPRLRQLCDAAERQWDAAGDFWGVYRYDEALPKLFEARDQFRAVVKLVPEYKAAAKACEAAKARRRKAEAGGAPSQSPDQWTEARDDFETGLRLFTNGKFGDARRRFQRAADRFGRAGAAVLPGERLRLGRDDFRRAWNGAERKWLHELAPQAFAQAQATAARAEAHARAGRTTRAADGYTQAVRALEAALARSRPPKYLVNSIGMTLVYIPPGSFTMGSAAGDPDAEPNERLARQVTIADGFYLGATEVTERQCRRIIGVRRTSSGRAIHSTKERERTQHWPASPKWTALERFCRVLSTREGRTYRLPTEAEWEYACRAGSTTQWCFGNDEAELAEYAWHRLAGAVSKGRARNPVGLKRPNAWGLYDMHGNVWEVCQDVYRAGPGAAPLQVPITGPGSRLPGGVRPEPPHVVRGGALDTEAKRCRSASRAPARGLGTGGALGGFRILCELRPAER